MLSRRTLPKKYGGVCGDLVSHAISKIETFLTSESLDQSMGQSFCPMLSHQPTMGQRFDLVSRLCPMLCPILKRHFTCTNKRRKDHGTDGTQKYPLVYTLTAIGRSAHSANTFRSHRRNTRRGVSVSRLSQGPNTRITARQDFDRRDTARDTHNSALSHQHHDIIDDF